jgi:hypothetical protein
MEHAIKLLVGPNGRWFYENSPEFLSELGDLRPDYDSVHFAIKNLGFIKFVRFGSLVEITMHPRNVEESALHAAQNLVSASQARMFRIRYFDNSWELETASSPRQAVSRMFELCAPFNSNGLTPRAAGNLTEGHDHIWRCPDPRSQRDASVGDPAVERSDDETRDGVAFRRDQDEPGID